MEINGYQIAPNAGLREANLCGADLYRADLRGADLCGAYLYVANLRGANLRGANLHGANLRGANLCGANLYRANLDRALGYIDLGVDPRGYHFRAVLFPHGWQITAGCRNFTVAEAVVHWGEAGNKDALARVAILEAHP